MRPAELLRRINRLATKRGWEVVISDGANHTIVSVGGRRTVIPRHPRDLKTGTFRAILKQIGLTPGDLED